MFLLIVTIRMHWDPISLSIAFKIIKNRIIPVQSSLQILWCSESVNNAHCSRSMLMDEWWKWWWQYHKKINDSPGSPWTKNAKITCNEMHHAASLTPTPPCFIVTKKLFWLPPSTMVTTTTRITTNPLKTLQPSLKKGLHCLCFNPTVVVMVASVIAWWLWWPPW